MYIVKVFGELNTWKGHRGNVARRVDAKRYKTKDEAWLYSEGKDYPERYEGRKKATQRDIRAINEPWAELGLAIAGQARADLKNLRLYGVIDNMTVIEKWPMWSGKPAKVSINYKSKLDAQELVDFFKNGWCGRLLRALDADICGDSITRKLNEEKGCAVL